MHSGHPAFTFRGSVEQAPARDQRGGRRRRRSLLTALSAMCSALSCGCILHVAEAAASWLWPGGTNCDFGNVAHSATAVSWRCAVAHARAAWDFLRLHASSRTARLMWRQACLRSWLWRLPGLCRGSCGVPGTPACAHPPGEARGCPMHVLAACPPSGNFLKRDRR